MKIQDKCKACTLSHCLYEIGPSGAYCQWDERETERELSDEEIRDLLSDKELAGIVR